MNETLESAYHVLKKKFFLTYGIEGSKVLEAKKAKKPKVSKSKVKSKSRKRK